MEINTLTQADTVVATMRTLPWLTMTMPACAAPLASTPEADLLAVSLPVVGYDSRLELISGASTAAAGITTNQIADVWGMGVDHKFSTRLGPTASPPV